MTSKNEDVMSGKRLNFLDNLRTAIVFSVVAYHAGGVYESSGIWAYFWIVDDPATNHLVGILNVIFDIFVMPTMFFISGYLTPLSLTHRGKWGFLKTRFKRLMIPWIIAVFTLIPFYKIIFLYSRNLPQEHWTSYFHFSNGIWNQNWLWFLPVLFLFDLLYVLLARMNCVPAKIPLKVAIAGTFVIGLVNSFGMDMLKIRGWTKTPLIDFQNERLLVYFMMFLLGSLCFRQNVFASRPKGKKLYIIVNSIAWIPINVYVWFLILPLIKPGAVLLTPVADRLVLWVSFYLSLLCLVYALVETFWRYFDKPGRIWKQLSRNSYYVYIIHVIVLGVIALLLLHTTLPSLVKYVILVASTYAASNGIISLCRSLAQSVRRNGS